MKEVDNEKTFHCYKCKGLGYLKVTQEQITIYGICGESMNVPGNITKDWCRVCNGTGVLDWVENARGQQKERFEFDSSSCVHVGF